MPENGQLQLRYF